MTPDSRSKLVENWDGTEDVSGMLDLLWDRYHPTARTELRRRLQVLYLEACHGLRPLIPHWASQLALKLIERVVYRKDPGQLVLTTQEAEQLGHARRVYLNARRERSLPRPRPGPCGRVDCAVECSDCVDLAAADWFAEGGAFAFDYREDDDPEVLTLVSTCEQIPRDQLEALLNPRLEAPANMRRLLCQVGYFVTQTGCLVTLQTPDDRRAGKPNWKGGFDHDLFMSADLVRRHFPDPIDLHSGPTLPK